VDEARAIKLAMASPAVFETLREMLMPLLGAVSVWWVFIIIVVTIQELDRLTNQAITMLAEAVKFVTKYSLSRHSAPLDKMQQPT
jgi:hypothetical protein